MGTTKSCLSIALAAAKNTMSAEDVKNLLQRLERVKEEKTGQGQLADLFQSVDKLAQDITDQARTAALLEKRNRVINIFAERERALTLQTFKDSPADGLKALNVGTQNGREGSRLSVASRQRAIHSQMLGGVMSKLHKENLLPFVKGSIDREIAIEMDLIGNPTSKSTPTGIPEAKRVAEILSEAQEAARVIQNDAGAIIGKLPGYIINQSHAYDMYKMRKLGKEYVTKRFMEALDGDGTFKGEDPIEFLDGVVDGLMSGVHLKVDGPSGTAGGSPFKGAFNLAKKLSQERVLKFKSPEAFYDFYKEFGQGTLMEAVASGLGRAADSAGIMQVWGTNPRLAFEAERMKLQQKYRNDPKALEKLKSPFRDYEFREVSGETRMVGSPSLAKTFSFIRGIQSLSKLGGAVVSSLTDVPMVANSLRYHGKNMFEAWGETLGTRISGLGAEEKAEFGDLMGLGMESFMGSFAGRFDAGDGIPGNMTKMVNTFFKLNLLNWWTDGWRETAGIVMSRNLAMKSGKSFADVGEDLSRVLGQYGIGEPEWNVIRQSAKDIEGRTYITPDALRELDDSVFKAYRSNENLTEGQMRRTRAELEQRLQAFFVDQVDYSVIQPDAGTRAMVNLGTNRGTIPGEVLRTIMQFKSFPIAVMQKTIGREIYGRGSKGVGDILSNPGGHTQELAGLAHIIAMGTLFGYGAMVAKDLLKGREPRDPKQMKTWMAAAVQGGGFGLYGDFLFGDYSRFGKSFVVSMLGPTASSIDDGVKLYGKIRDSAFSLDGDEAADAAATAFRTTINHLPFANLFYTRIALDYLILYDIQEAMNPGSLSRMEQRTQKENAQQFIFHPTTDRLTPVTGQP